MCGLAAAAAHILAQPASPLPTVGASGAAFKAVLSTAASSGTGLSVASSNNSGSGVDLQMSSTGGTVGANVGSASTNSGAYLFRGTYSSGSAAGTGLKIDHGGTSGDPILTLAPGTGIREHIQLYNNATAATNNGPSIAFAANRTTGGQTTIATIAGIATNVTNASSAGALTFQAATNGSAPAEVMRISGNGSVSIGSTATSANLLVSGSSGATFQMVDGHQSAGYVMTSTATGQAYWAASSGGGMGTMLIDGITKASGAAFACNTYGTAIPFTSSDAVTGSDTSMMGVANKFTAQHTGWHQLSGYLIGEDFSNATNHWMEVGYTVNAGSVGFAINNSFMTTSAGSGRRNTMSLIAPIYLNANDTVTVRCNSSSDSSNHLDQYGFTMAESSPH